MRNDSCSIYAKGMHAFTSLEIGVSGTLIVTNDRLFVRYWLKADTNI